ncbi:MAG: hypothetical protein K9M45_00045 [Kiritimatiellales bacterium]|nr:hypothetical protein [Kiritimatiellales bacterium]
MDRIIAIAGLAVRSAIRSRVVAVLAGSVLVLVVLLPLTLKGDGTVEGYIHILLSYTLGALSFLLSLATLWAGCAAVSTDVRGRQIHLIAVKPVRPVEIWLGKWLGLLALNAVLLAAAGTLIYGMLRWNTRPAALDPADRATIQSQLLTARKAVPAITDGKVFGITSGASRHWKFQAPVFQTLETGTPLFLRYRISATDITALRVKGRWRTAGFEAETVFMPNTFQTLELPFPGIGKDGALDLEFINSHDRPLTLVFDPQHPPAILYRSGSFEMNYARCLLIIFCQLALLAAVGVSAGSVFTMPVAAFVSVWVLIMIASSGFIEHMTASENALARLWFHFLNLVLLPFRNENPLEPLATGRAVSWAAVGLAVLLKAVLFSGLLAWGSVALFKRGEIAGGGRS